MNEPEWLTTPDAHAMMEYLTAGLPRDEVKKGWSRRVTNGRITERKLRLFGYAWRLLAGLPLDDDCREESTPPAVIQLHNTTGWALSLARLSQVTPFVQAALLRDLAGNPFKPWHVVHDWRNAADARRRGDNWFWAGHCTPTVVALAAAAYEERGRKCEQCKGYGFFGLQQAAPGSVLLCPDCKGTGTTDGGTLDPDRLLVLGDALEEAGCEDAEILNHLRGKERDVCDRCGGDGQAHGADRPFEWSPDPDYTKCPVCKGSGRGTGWMPKRGPCVRGCWVLDLLLGRS